MAMAEGLDGVQFVVLSAAGDLRLTVQLEPGSGARVCARGTQKLLAALGHRRFCLSDLRVAGQPVDIVQEMKGESKWLLLPDAVLPLSWPQSTPLPLTLGGVPAAVVQALGWIADCNHLTSDKQHVQSCIMHAICMTDGHPMPTAERNIACTAVNWRLLCTCVRSLRPHSTKPGVHQYMSTLF